MYRSAKYTSHKLFPLQAAIEPKVGMGALLQLGAHTQDNSTIPLCMTDNFQSTKVKARRNTEPSPKLLQHQERWWTSAQSTTLGLPPGPTTNNTLVNYANNIPTFSIYVNM